MLFHIQYDNELNKPQVGEHYYIETDSEGNVYLSQEWDEGLKFYPLYTDKQIDVVQRIHGEWLMPPYPYRHFHASCNRCGYKDELTSGDDDVMKMLICNGYKVKRYCPNCGAYMDKSINWQNHVNKLRKEIENEEKN